MRPIKSWEQTTKIMRADHKNHESRPPAKVKLTLAVKCFPVRNWVKQSLLCKLWAHSIYDLAWPRFCRTAVGCQITLPWRREYFVLIWREPLTGNSTGSAGEKNSSPRHVLKQLRKEESRVEENDEDPGSPTHFILTRAKKTHRSQDQRKYSQSGMTGRKGLKKEVEMASIRFEVKIEPVVSPKQTLKCYAIMLMIFVEQTWHHSKLRTEEANSQR